MLAEENGWTPVSDPVIEKTADICLDWIGLRGDERICANENGAFSAEQYNYVHALTGRDVYDSNPQIECRYLSTVFTRYQLDHSPAWTLIRMDESLAKDYR